MQRFLRPPPPEAALSVPRRFATTPVHPGTRRLCLSVFRRIDELYEELPASTALFLAVPRPADSLAHLCRVRRPPLEPELRGHNPRPHHPDGTEKPARLG